MAEWSAIERPAEDSRLAPRAAMLGTRDYDVERQWSDPVPAFTWTALDVNAAAIARR